MKQLSELLDEIEEKEAATAAVPTRPMERSHILASAGYWFKASRKAQDKGKSAEAVMCMENAYNHVENALATCKDFIHDYAQGVLMRDGKTYGQRAWELLSLIGGKPDDASGIPKRNFEPLSTNTHVLQNALSELDAEYHRLLEEASHEVGRCIRNDDKHGKNFYQGKKSGLVCFDIALTNLKHILSEHGGSSDASLKQNSQPNL